MRVSVLMWLRILALVLFSWPVCAQENPITAELAPDRLLSAVEMSPLPAPIPDPRSHFNPQLPPLPENGPANSTSSLPAYWMVSSRCSVQNIHEACRGSWGVTVSERRCSGEMVASSLPELVAQLDPTQPVCIFVHGSFVEFESQCQQAHAFYRRLAPCYPGRLQLIFFTWPSDGPRTGWFPLDVAVRGRQADFNGFHLAYLISQIPESCPVTMIGHSHGARMILATMHLAGGGTVEGHYFPYSMGANRRFRAVLAAGAMDHNWLNPGQVYCCALNRLECVLNLRNRRDSALGFYPLSRPFAHRAVARSGFTRLDYYLLGANGAKLHDADVTTAVGASHYWPEYYNSPAVISWVLSYLTY